MHYDCALRLNIYRFFIGPFNANNDPLRVSDFRRPLTIYIFDKFRKFQITLSKNRKSGPVSNRALWTRIQLRIRKLPELRFQPYLEYGIGIPTKLIVDNFC